MNNISKNTNIGRLEDFDIAKGIATFLVVLSHLLEQAFCTWEQVQRVIIFCHMPVFFFMSGFFLFYSVNKYSKKEILQKKAKQLIIPYICWSFVSLLANIILAARNESIDNIIVKQFLDIFIYARSLWFLIALFITQSVFMGLLLLSEYININKYFVLFSGWIIVSLITPSDYFAMYKFKWLFPFLIIGVYYAEHRAQLIALRKWTMLSVIFPVLCVLFYNTTYYNAYLFFDYTNLKEIIAGFIYYLFSLLAITFILSLSAILCRIKRNAPILLVSQYSLEIYVCHMFFVKFIVLPTDAIANNIILLSVYIILYTIIILTLIILFCKFLFSRFKIYRFIMGKF